MIMTFVISLRKNLKYFSREQGNSEVNRERGGKGNCLHGWYVKQVQQGKVFFSWKCSVFSLSSTETGCAHDDGCEKKNSQVKNPVLTCLNGLGDKIYYWSFNPITISITF